MNVVDLAQPRESAVQSDAGGHPFTERIRLSVLPFRGKPYQGASFRRAARRDPSTDRVRKMKPR
jgi:hypothetical protein